MPLEPSQYKEMVITKDKLTATHGYLSFYSKDHPLSNDNGMVTYARHLVSVEIGRWITPNEIVSYLDGDPKNLAIENLVLMTRAQLLRQTMDWPEKVELICGQCKSPFLVHPSKVLRRRHCSNKCRDDASRKFEISREELEQLLEEMPMTHIAEMLGVSDKAVAKRRDKLGIEPLPPGYWRIMETGHTDPSVIKELDSSPSFKNGPAG
ncbi:MAG: HNH endonuclease [Chloroflexota bacterium]